MSRKISKLKYIREKNRINRGGIFRVVFKMSQSLTVDQLKEQIEFKAQDYLVLLQKKYKTKVDIHEIEIGLLGDDYETRCYTCMVCFRKS